MPDFPLADTKTKPSQPIRVGMIGLGTVGTGVFKILNQRPDIEFVKIAVSSTSKKRTLTDLNSRLLTTDATSVVNDPSIPLVIEVMGGADLAKELVATALQNGKHVVTANKELIAKHGDDLFQLAKTHNVCLMFEAAVAAGIPIIMPLKLSLAANHIQEIVGILNGTTNYILTKMTDQGWSYQDALLQAQKKGFAEANPASDVEGQDTAYKIAILAAIANGKRVPIKDVYVRGITAITVEDIQLAESLGYTIKLVGLFRQADAGQMDIRVQPMLISHEHPLASIKNENNAIFVKGDAVGEVMFYGKGAGEMPTASAVCADVLTVVKDLSQGNRPLPSMQVDLQGYGTIQPITETVNKYFVRLKACEKPGVIGLVGTACGNHQVSIDSIVQHGLNPDGTASVIFVTQLVREQQMLAALDDIKRADSIQAISTVLRIL